MTGPLRYNPRRMKLTAKNLPTLLRILLLCLLVGTLAWEILERVLEYAGLPLSLGIGPVGFDLRVISLWAMFNPGSLIGIVPAFLLFRRL